ncbi:hypothetical protein [Solidesulfovibrio sp.]|uniref:hypothetical protein n=1 Tax=Solidesulfovibrio sp. TaxID=2910990 RepID=UPI002B1FBF8E|nr:hypothetical protein [Solidesulfovibrio sp.]MEA4858563.1 hypothetical protein [Solidesulfovibrio sp.]
MDSRQCCVCGRPIEALDIFILRAQGRICSRCVVERGIPVGGQLSRRQLHRGNLPSRPVAGKPIAAGFPVI